MNPVYRVLYKGKKYDVFEDKSLFWNDLKFTRDKFLLKPGTANNIVKFNKLYDRFSKTELQKVIDKKINRVLNKRINVKIRYVDSNNKEFFKKQKLSANEFIKLIEFNKTKIEIDLYEGLWGSNKKDFKAKSFILRFNINLVKRGNDEQINYVIAHEVAHIFYRDHGSDFYDALQQYTGWGERKLRDFWNSDFSKNLS